MTTPCRVSDRMIIYLYVYISCIGCLQSGVSIGKQANKDGGSPDWKDSSPPPPHPTLMFCRQPDEKADQTSTSCDESWTPAALKSTLTPVWIHERHRRRGANGSMSCRQQRRLPPPPCGRAHLNGKKKKEGKKKKKMRVWPCWSCLEYSWSVASLH